MSTQIGVDEQLCNIITFNGQNCSGKTAQSKDSIELLMCTETVTDEVVRKIEEVWDKQSGCL